MRGLEFLALLLVFLILAAYFGWLLSIEVRNKSPCAGTTVFSTSAGAFEHRFNLTFVTTGPRHVDLMLQDMSDPSININNMDPAHVTLPAAIPAACRPRVSFWSSGVLRVVEGSIIWEIGLFQLDAATGDIQIYLTDGTIAVEWSPFPSLFPLDFYSNVFSYSL